MEDEKGLGGIRRKMRTVTLTSKIPVVTGVHKTDKRDDGVRTCVDSGHRRGRSKKYKVRVTQTE